MATTKKTAARKGPDAYTARIATDAVDTERFVVSVLVMRRDGKPMTQEDLAAAAAVYPRAEVVGSEPHGRAEEARGAPAEAGCLTES